MTKEERYTIWNRYYQRHKTEINARRKIVRENYKNKLSKAENKIAELERKLEQTEKDLTDYQFNYPKIKDLEKENATLKKQLEALSGDIPWNELKDVSEVTKKLTEAKEIIKGLLSCARNYPEGNLEKMQRAENFLKE